MYKKGYDENDTPPTLYLAHYCRDPQKLSASRMQAEPREPPQQVLAAAARYGGDRHSRMHERTTDSECSLRAAANTPFTTDPTEQSSFA